MIQKNRNCSLNKQLTVIQLTADYNLITIDSSPLNDFILVNTTKEGDNHGKKFNQHIMMDIAMELNGNRTFEKSWILKKDD